MRGPFPSRMSGTRIASCAATWTSSGFHASMERGRLPGYSACFVIPPIVALRAGTASFRSVLTGGSYPRGTSWTRERNRIPFQINDAAPSGHIRLPLAYSAASYENCRRASLALLLAIFPIGESRCCVVGSRLQEFSVSALVTLIRLIHRNLNDL